jgi:RNA polymerase sigma-70 factor (ECF subfamily)
MLSQIPLEFRSISSPLGAALPPSTVETEIAVDLVRRIAEGDRGAEARLVERYGRSLLQHLLRQGVGADTAQDLRQETFRIALERLRRRGLAAPDRLAGFLHGIARKLALAERRKRVRRRTDAVEEEMEASEDPSPGPLETAIASQERRLLEGLIGRLPVDRDRQLLRRYYVAEEDGERICAELGLDRPHLKRVLFRARQRILELATSPPTSPPRRR